MKLSTLKSKCKLLNINSNAKTSKGDDDNKLTAIMYLASADTSGYETCTASSPQCRQMCLLTAGRGAFTNVQQARVNRTKLFFEDQSKFLNQLYEELSYFLSYCTENNLQPYARLNGTSDLNFIGLNIKDDKDIFQLFPSIQFYDYTKHFERESDYSNYYLLYSRSENTSIETIKTLIDSDKNVAVVFDEVPIEWEGMRVINGDETDLRAEDDTGVIVGLKAKAKAKRSKRKIVPDNESFVINTIQVE